MKQDVQDFGKTLAVVQTTQCAQGKVLELLERGQKETIEHIQKIHADELKLKLEEQDRKLKQTQEARWQG